jgi:mono/diheme cytochrome c family protein
MTAAMKGTDWTRMDVMSTCIKKSRCVMGAFMLLAVAWTPVGYADPASGLSVWDGIYTAAQAETGKGLFDRACIACHSDRPGEISGHGATPTIIGEAFRFSWVDASVADLFDTIRQTMPEDAPSSLSAAEYAAVTAYVLQLNGYPAGGTELDPGQRYTLLHTFIDEAPPAPP